MPKLKISLFFTGLLLLSCLLAACSSSNQNGDGGTFDDANGDGVDSAGDFGDLHADPDSDHECPIDPCVIIEGFPFTHSADTTNSVLGQFDSYSCAPDLGQAGPEIVYMFEIDQPGTLVVMLDDGGNVGADIDIHLLLDPDPQTCLARGHIGLSTHLMPGCYFLVADSYSNSEGVALPGPYNLYAHFLPDGTNCAMLSDPIRRIGASEPLAMPATGSVVKEAHLVSDQEFGDGSWPQSFTDSIEQHYSLTESTTDYIMERSEPWCPCCEPSNEYGQGSSARPPLEAEAFYICMRWANAPPRGQRYIVFNARTAKAVVTAAGYENGPGDLSRIGGACEEIHHHLGTTHLSVMTFGVAADQNLDYGPIVCEE